MIAEPQRAFSGGQFQLVFPQLTHYGIELWVRCARPRRGGSWLGGRPNYGYRLVDTDTPHPQRNKAAAGIRLRVLEPDPDTAPVVQRIFDLFDQGVGYRSIATVLEREGFPLPVKSVRPAIPDRPVCGAVRRCGRS